MPPKYKPLTSPPPAKKAPAPIVVNWANEPAKHDYPAAGNYLSLLADEKLTNELVDRLEKAPTIFHRANDILRAAQLPLLEIGDFRVQTDLVKIVNGDILSPVLIIRGDILKGFPTTIADGYHRVCASYHLSEGTYIPCRIAEAYGRDRELPLLLADPHFAQVLDEGLPSLRRVVAQAALSGVPTPAFASSLSYYDGLRAERTSAAVIQGQRDLFGAHTYRRVDKEGSFHTLWAGDRSEVSA